MKILIEEKDETQKYRIVPIEQLLAMTRVEIDKVMIYIPNLCGGETRVTIYRSTNPDGHTGNIELLKNK